MKQNNFYSQLINYCSIVVIMKEKQVFLKKLSKNSTQRFSGSLSLNNNISSVLIHISTLPTYYF